MARISMRATMFVRNTEGIKAKLRAVTAGQKGRLLAVSIDEAHEVFELAAAMANFKTGYMLEHMVLEFTRGGFNWVVGFRREDFVGQANPRLPGPDKVIKVFYPVFVLKGTRFYAGNDFLEEARRIRRPVMMRRFKAALGPERAGL